MSPLHHFRAAMLIDMWHACHLSKKLCDVVCIHFAHRDIGDWLTSVTCEKNFPEEVGMDFAHRCLTDVWCAFCTMWLIDILQTGDGSILLPSGVLKCGFSVQSDISIRRPIHDLWMRSMALRSAHCSAQRCKKSFGKRLIFECCIRRPQRMGGFIWLSTNPIATCVPSRRVAMDMEYANLWHPLLCMSTGNKCALARRRDTMASLSVVVAKSQTSCLQGVFGLVRGHQDRDGH